MEVHFKIVGVLLVVLALSHFFFPRYFEWKQNLRSLSVMNRQMFYVHSFFIALMVFLMGVLSLFYSSELMRSSIGRKICLGLGIFWMARLVVQLFVYSPTLWKGKKFETAIHVLFSIFWTYLSIIFFIAYL